MPKPIKSRKKNQNNRLPTIDVKKVSADRKAELINSTVKKRGFPVTQANKVGKTCELEKAKTGSKRRKTYI
jgi:hypothetical protein